MGWQQLAEGHFFGRDFTAFRSTTERAISLNPRNGTSTAYLGFLTALSGDWERGVAMTRRILNRHHPGWYFFTLLYDHLLKGEYETALEVAKKINMPEFHWPQLVTASTCGLLGRQAEARAAIESLRKYNRSFSTLSISSRTRRNGSSTRSWSSC